MDDGFGQLPEGVREGEELAGKYRIGSIIGVGAMGVVVAARHNLLGQRVAIKFLNVDPREHAGAVVRFVQEAQAAMAIQSEHVVRVRDVAMLESGVPYIVMEYLDGIDLASLLRRAGPLPIRDAVDYLLEACEAIAEAHRSGIIHRDLKPSNLFLVHWASALPSIKVLDFGISKSTALVRRALDGSRTPRDGGMTGDKTILGSPSYMSPEQMESARDVDVRTDVWALGVTLFELLTGKRPYTGNSMVQVYSKIVARGPPRWKEELVNCPAGLDAVISRCLARDRNRRYPSVGDLARALKRFGSARAEVSLLRIKQTFAGSGMVQSSTLEPHTLRAAGSRPDIDNQGGESPLGAEHSVAPGRMLAAAIVMTAATLVLGLSERWRNSQAAGQNVAATLALSVERSSVPAPTPPIASAEEPPQQSPGSLAKDGSVNPRVETVDHARPAHPHVRAPRPAKPKRTPLEHAAAISSPVDSAAATSSRPGSK